MGIKTKKVFVFPTFLSLILLSAQRASTENSRVPVGSYSFAWRVQDDLSGNDYGHKEDRKVDDVTHGEYFVRLPDGRLQTVTYYVDPVSGFRAKVAYEGVSNIENPAFNIRPSKIVVTGAPANLAPVRVPSPRPLLQNVIRKDKALRDRTAFRPTATPQPIQQQQAQLFQQQQQAQLLQQQQSQLFQQQQQAQLLQQQQAHLFQQQQQAQLLQQQQQQVHLFQQQPQTLEQELQPQQPFISPSSVRPNIINPPILGKFELESPKPVKNPFLPVQNQVEPSKEELRKGKSGSSKELFNVHNKMSFFKSESELAGRDFSEPFYYPFETKIIKHETL